MKKFKVIVVVVLLCAVSWAGATYVVGSRVENEFSGLVKQYGNLGLLTVTLKNYQRGFLSSTAQTVTELKFPGMSADNREGEQADEQQGPVQLVFDHTLYHGPFPIGGGPAMARIETRLVGVSPGQEKFEKLLQELPRLKEPLVVTTVAYNGDLDSRMEIQPIESRIDGDLLSWGGLTVKAVFSPRNKTVAGSIEMSGLTVRGSIGEIVWDGAHGRFDLAEAMPLVYVGKSEIKINALKLSVPNKETGENANIEMKGFEVSSSSSCERNLVQVAQTMAFAGLTLEEQTYGPGVIEIELRNLDGEAIGTYQKQLYEVFGGMNSTPPDQLMMQLLPIYSQLFAKLAEGNPQLNIRRLHFATPKGDIDGSLSISFVGGKGMTMDNPAALMQRIEANAECVVHEQLIRSIAADSAEGKLKQAREAGSLPNYSDTELVAMAEKQAGEQVEAVLAQRFLVREGDRLKTSASFRGGEFVVNGQSLPLFQ